MGGGDDGKCEKLLIRRWRAGPRGTARDITHTALVLCLGDDGFNGAVLDWCILA